MPRQISMKLRFPQSNKTNLPSSATRSRSWGFCGTRFSDRKIKCTRLLAHTAKGYQQFSNFLTCSNYDRSDTISTKQYQRPRTSISSKFTSTQKAKANGTDSKMAPTSPSVPKLTSTSHPPLLIKKLSPNATTPTRGSAFAAGYDLYASVATSIPARGKTLVSTDLSIATPEGTYGRVAPRSGLASKHFIDTGAGVIDADYRGEVKVLLFNHSDVDFEVKKGDRIAQLVLERIYTPEIVEVENLEESVRGAGGFGSTG